MRLSSTFKQVFNGCLVIIVGGFFLLHHSAQGVLENEEAIVEGVESGVEGVEDGVEGVENGVEKGSDYQSVLMSKLVHLREECGELCDLDRPLHPPPPGAIMATTRAKVTTTTTTATALWCHDYGVQDAHPGCLLNHLSTIPACRSSFVGLYGLRKLVGGQRVTAGGLDGRVAGTSPHNTGVGGRGVGY